MRSSRLSQETAKLFSTTASHSEPALRRSARSSLSRFAYRESSTSSRDENDADDGSDITFGSDIEDAIKSNATPSPPPANGRTRKRKRTTTTTVVKADASSPRIKIKTETETETTTSLPADVRSPPAKAARRVRKPARTTTDPSTGATTVSPPSDWEEMYALVKAMRLTGPAAHAAVDTMGCERLARPEASARDRRFHTLVALMLSSQTKDTVNAAAMARMHAEMPPHAEGAPPGLNLENMLAVDPAKLNEMIWQVGFHNNKTKFLKQAAEILRDKFGGDIPPTIEGLTSLPGVGPKMAYLCMGAENGWDSVQGIGVDVHVHRITNLWGWNDTKTPEATRLALQAWLPHDRWREVNWLLVGFGQKVCLPVGRRCGECELGLRGLCRSAERKKVLEGRRVREAARTEVKGGGEDGTVVKTEEVVEEETTALRDVVVNEEVVPGVLDEKQPARGRRRVIKSETVA